MSDALRAALDAAADVIVLTDASGCIVEANAAALRFNGYDRDQVVGRDLLELATENNGDDAEQDAIRAAHAGQEVTYISHRRTRDGRPVSARVHATPLPGGGAVFVTAGLDAQRERINRTLRMRMLAEAARTLGIPQDLEATLSAAAAIVVPEWADGALIALAEGERFRIATLHTADPSVQATAKELMPPDLGGVISGGLLDRVVSERRPVLVRDAADPELPEVTRERLERLGISSIILVPLVADEELVGVLMVSRHGERRFDASDADLFDAVGGRAALGIRAARLHEAMRAAEIRFRAAFEHAPIGIAIFRVGPDDTAWYLEVNPAMCMIAGRRREELLSRPASEFTHPDDREGERQRFHWLQEGRLQETSGEKRLVRPDGEARWIQVRSAALGDGTFVQQAQDVTEHRRFQRELEHLASHDTLTGLLNRRRFEESLEQALANVRRHGDQVAVLTLDIDNFKHVNDTYGHAAGDELLRLVGDALQARIRATDRLARLGGDEFGVILARTDAEGARAAGNELLQAVRDVRLAVGERSIGITASAGLRTLAAHESASPGDLLSEADMAMYDAKEHGRDRLSVLRPGDQAPERARARQRWSERIRDALEGGASRFVLYEQPIVRLADGALDRSELLIRLVDENGDLNPPARFLGVAERYGQMQAIDRWVVGRALDLLQRRDGGHAFEVNLSGESISDPAAVDAIIAAVDGASVDASRLIFEVTETSAIGNLDQARGLAERLTQLGCGFALDDFGAGFGSFAYLKHLPLDIIKIDGEFIRGLRTSRTDQVTVRAIVSIARALGKETVAEFVEDEETLNLLRALGVDRAQGYFVGRPEPVGAQPA